MHRNYFSINLFLFLIIGALGLTFYETVPAQASLQHVESTTKAHAGRTTSPLPGSAYDIIARNDLTRSATEREDNIAAGLSKNAPVLFGTIIMDNRSMAILEDPSTKVTTLYNINDSLSGFVISDIQKDKIIMKNGGTTIEVNLRDEKKIKTSQNAGPQIAQAQQAQPPEQPSSNEDAVSETEFSGSSDEDIPIPSSSKGDPQSFSNTFTKNSQTKQNNGSDFIEKFKSLSVSRRGRHSQKTLNLQKPVTPKSSAGGVFGIQK